MSSVDILEQVIADLSLSFREQCAPQVILIITSLNQCQDLLSDPDDEKINGRRPAEAHALMKRYYGLLSSGTKSDSVAVQWIAVHLIKYTVELGGVRDIQTLAIWVKGMLGLVASTNIPTTTIKTSLAAITHIFMRSKDDQRLVRELVTPLLPSFISICVDILNTDVSTGNRSNQNASSTSYHEQVLQCFSVIVPEYSTMFRPSRERLHGILVRMVAPPITYKTTCSNDRSFPPKVCNAARTLYVKLHYLATKTEISKEWQRMLDNVMDAISVTMEKLSTYLDADSNLKNNERWRSNSNSQKQKSNALSTADWNDSHEGSIRLTGLLCLLQEFFRNATWSTVEVRLGNVVSLIRRVFILILSLEKPRKRQADEMSRLRLGFTDWIQAAALQVLIAVLDRFNKAAVSICAEVLSIILLAFKAGLSQYSNRSKAYALLQRVVTIIGPAMTKAEISSARDIIQSCCEDNMYARQTLQENTPLVSNQMGKNTSTLKVTNQPHRLKGLPCFYDEFYPSETSPLQQTAQCLLVALLRHLSPDATPTDLRSMVERTAVLTGSKEAMLASTLNRPSENYAGGRKSGSSLVPFLARMYPNSLETEGLVRPRMPVLMDGRGIASVKLLDANGQDMNGVDGEDHSAIATVSSRYHIDTDSAQVNGNSGIPQPGSTTLESRPIDEHLLKRENENVDTSDHATKRTRTGEYNNSTSNSTHDLNGSEKKPISTDTATLPLDSIPDSIPDTIDPPRPNITQPVPNTSNADTLPDAPSNKPNDPFSTTSITKPTETFTEKPINKSLMENSPPTTNPETESKINASPTLPAAAAALQPTKSRPVESTDQATQPATANVEYDQNDGGGDGVDSDDDFEIPELVFGQGVLEEVEEGEGEGGEED